MKDYLKNLFAARGAAFWLNLLGLSLAFVIFYVLMAEVMWHVTFDRFHKDADRVCQVFYEDTSLEEWEKIFPSLKEKKDFSASFSEEICRSTQDFEASVIVFNGYNYDLSPIDVEGMNEPIKAPVIDATEGLFEVFTFNLIEGDTAAIHDPNNVFIPLSLARKLFGESGPYVGRRFGEKDFWEVCVGGVYRDFPTNSQLNNVMYRSFSRERWDRFLGDGDLKDFNLFVKLRKGVDGELLSENLRINSIMLRNEAARFTFLPIHDVYFTNIEDRVHLGETFRRHGGNYGVVTLLALAALFIIVVGSINYVNFSMAMVPYQIKNINVRRVFGEKASSIRWHLMGQALLNVALAVLMAYALLVIIIQKGLVDEWLKCDLSFGHNGAVIGMTVVLALLVPIVAGGYPAWYVTSRKPALVINGSFALSPAGRSLRRGLISFQFAVAIMTVLMVLLVISQNHYVRTAPVGYARDSVMYVFVKDYWQMDMEAYYDPLTDLMKNHPAVKEVSWSYYCLGEDNRSKWSTTYEGNFVGFKGFPVSHNFLTTMGIKITEGRNFRLEDEGKTCVICNETARKMFGLKLNTSFWGDIIGFCEDIKYGSFKKSLEPIAFVVGQGRGGYCVLRLTSPDKIAEVRRYVDEVFAKVIDGTSEWEIYTNSDIADAAYADEMRQLKLLVLVSIISLLIPLIGVFGLVLFETQARRKEVGIRKVFGATTKRILVMFNWEYLRILVVCFVIAAPVAYSLYERWIETFAYRTPMHWWLFGVAFLLVAAVICLTVTVQSWRAAKERPVDTIMK